VNRAVCLLFSLSLLLVGCSEQWREGDTGYEAEKIAAMLREATSTSVSALRDDPETWIYFADTSGPMGGVASVLAFDDMEFLGAGPDTYIGQFSTIKAARVFYLDRLTESGHDAELIVGIDQSGSGFQYYTMSGTGVVTDGVYEAVLTGSNGNTVTLRSNDTEDIGLKDIIQLRAYVDDGAGGEVMVGKFSTLIGYGP
jgi:hypothetical protein